MRDRRLLSLWLPRLSTDRLARGAGGPHPGTRGTGDAPRDDTAAERGAPSRPFATVSREKGALVLAAVDAIAEARGLAPGLGFAEARAQVPDLAVDAHDPDADAALLERVADLCERYTPLVAVSDGDGLFLDLTGCTHLFGGEAPLRADLFDRLRRHGLAVRAAIAGTPGAAWALARHGAGADDPLAGLAEVSGSAAREAREGCTLSSGDLPGRAGALGPIVASGQEASALAALPVAALRLEAEIPPVLRRLGLRTVADLDAQPRAGLARRFGPGLLARLDAALGRADEPIAPRLPPPRFVRERRFADPLFSPDGLRAVLDRLAEGLCETLESRGEGARRLLLALFATDGVVHRVEAGTSAPLIAPDRIAAVLAPRLETVTARLDSDAGVDLVRLAALETGPADPVQGDLEGSAAASADLARLVDALSARLGADAVRRLVPCDTHDPARAVAARPALGTPPATREPGWSAPAAAGVPQERPLRMLQPPEPVEAVAAVPDGPPLRFRWRKVAYEVAAAEGPERIAPEWWRATDQAATRDYFSVEDVDGRRFWLFREGLYGRETDRPGWFLHGVFA